MKRNRAPVGFIFLRTVLSLFLAALTLLFCACENGTPADTDPVTDPATSEPSVPETLAPVPERDPDERSMYDEAFDFSAYLRLCDYHGLTVSADPPSDVSDDVISFLIAGDLASHGYYTKIDEKRGIEKGDVAKIDFESMIDGEEYQGGSRTDFCLLVGIGSFFDAFEDALLGHEAGETVSFQATYPEDYDVSSLAGKTADFSVTILELGKVDPLTDASAKTLSGVPDMDAERYRRELTDVYAAANRVEYKGIVYEQLWEQLEAGSEILSVPVCDRLHYCDEMVAFLTAYMESQGVSYEDYLEQEGTNAEEMYRQLYETSLEPVRQELILCAVCRAEGLDPVIPEDEGERLFSDYFLLSGKTFDTFRSENGAYGYRAMLQFQYTMERVAQYAVIESPAAS